MNLVARILSDLAKSKDNQILFDNLLLALTAIEVDLDFSKEVLLRHYSLIFKLIND